MTATVTYARGIVVSIFQKPIVAAPVLSVVCIVFHKVHGVTRLYRLFKVFEKRNSLDKLITGCMIDCVVENSTFLRTVTQTLFVAIKLIDCIKQQGIVINTGRDLIAEIKGQIASEEADRQKGIRAKSSRVAKKTYRLMKECFKLSCKLLDVVDAIRWLPEARLQAVNECYLDANWLKGMIDSKEEIFLALETNKEPMTQLIKEKNYDRLVKAVKMGVAGAEKIYLLKKEVKAVSSSCKKAAVHCKQALGAPAADDPDFILANA